MTKFKKIFIVLVVLVLVFDIIVIINKNDSPEDDGVMFTCINPPVDVKGVITESRAILYTGEDEETFVCIDIISRIYPEGTVQPSEVREFIVPLEYDKCVECEIMGRPAHIYRIGKNSQLVCAVSSTCCVSLIYKPKEFSDAEVVEIAESLEVFNQPD